MAYDEALAERIRQALPQGPSVTERRMFGGLAFMLDGHMAFGVIDATLMLRLGSAEAERARSTPHVRPMDFTGRPLKGYVYVAPDGLLSDDALRSWLRRAAAFVATLPPK